MNNLRVAWLLPTAWFYWQPILSEFTELFPQTKVFTALFPGLTPKLNKPISIEVVGKQVKIQSKVETTSYGSKFTFLSPRIIINLFKFKPEVIFTSSFGVWTILALLLKPLGGWKVIIAYEGSSPSVDYRNSQPRLLLRRGMVALADACISNSKTGREYIINCLKADPKLVFAQPYQVPDLNTWSEAETKSAKPQESQVNPRPVFLFVGRIIPRKGLKLLVEACLLLKQKGIEQYTIQVVGDGTQREELERLCQENQLEQINWLGRVEYAKVGNYLKEADVFVLPTLEDTWGMVILEAMLCGKPILCSQGAGASELVVEGENGYCFPTNDAAKLAEAIAKFIEHPELTATMGRKSRQIMVKHTPAKAAGFWHNMVDLVVAS